METAASLLAPDASTYSEPKSYLGIALPGGQKVADKLLRTCRSHWPIARMCVEPWLAPMHVPLVHTLRSGRRGLKGGVIMLWPSLRGSNFPRHLAYVADISEFAWG
jgi:hypothetical protein